MIEGYAVPDFISGFWHYYIAGVTIISIIGVMWFLKNQTTQTLAPGEKAQVMEHAWDGDLQELNNPLPRWWLYLFWFLIVFGIVYLALYPGLGKFTGAWNWSSAGAYSQEKEELDAAFNQEFEPFKGKDVMAVAADAKARKMGENLFLTYCMQCHGTSGQGDGKNFPNLTDSKWLFGGEPEAIRTSIANGRLNAMPPNLLGNEQSAKEVANYVLSLGGKPHDAALAAAGQAKFAICGACHGPDGKSGTGMIGPNLTDDAWQYGGSEAAIVETVMKGRTGGMPAFQAKLNDAKIHLLASYVWGLGGGVKPAPAPAPETMPAPDAVPPTAEAGSAAK